MGITERMQSRTPMLMEAALGERLKSEYHLVPDEQVALSGILYGITIIHIFISDIG